MTEYESKASRVLAIEDIRVFAFPATYARTVAEAWPLLFENEWDEVWFDHDMGLSIDSENTYGLALEMERRAYEGETLPIGKVFVHTANPAGGDRIVAALARWYPTWRVSANDYLAPRRTALQVG